MRGRAPGAVLAVHEGLQFLRHHPGVAVALAAFPAARILGGRVLRDAAYTGVVDAYHDQRQDWRAESRVGIEEILPVLQIKHRARGCAGVVPGGKIDDDIARRREVARSETGMQTDPPLVFGSILGQRTSVSHYQRDLPGPVSNR